MHITPSYLLRAFRSRKLQLFSMSGRHFKKKSLKASKLLSLPASLTKQLRMGRSRDFSALLHTLRRVYQAHGVLNVKIPVSIRSLSMLIETKHNLICNEVMQILLDCTKGVNLLLDCSGMSLLERQKTVEFIKPFLKISYQGNNV